MAKFLIGVTIATLGCALACAAYLLVAGADCYYDPEEV